MIVDFEIGYTPFNLKAMRKSLGKTQGEIAELLKVSLVTVQRWEMESEKNSHVGMPHRKWIEFMEYVRENLSDSAPAPSGWLERSEGG